MDWKEKTIKEIQLLGQEVAEHAEDYITDNDEFLTDISITLNIGVGDAPSIRVYKYFFSKKVLEETQKDWVKN